VRGEVSEQLRASLIHIDSPDVQDERPGNAVLLSESVGSDAFRNSRPDSDDRSRHTLIVRYGVNQRPLLERVVHDRANASEDRLKDGQTERGVPFGCWYQDGFIGDRARAMVRLIVPN